MATVNEIYVFDIDGVITDLITHEIRNPKLLQFIIDILKKNEPIAFNTGRPFMWVKEGILKDINDNLEDKSLLKNLIIVVEKGGEWIEFDENGNELIRTDANIKIPEELESELKKLVSEKFSKVAFYDENKKTMATLQKAHEISLDEFENSHKNLDYEIEKVLNNSNYKTRYKIASTTIATDVESVKAGKNLGMEKVLDWLKNRNLETKKYLTFGDSISDLDMANHLFEKGHNVEFIYVGNKKFNLSKYKFPITVTTKKYDEGTLEYLQVH